MWESIRTSPAVLSKSDNVEITVGISLLSCVEAKIYFMSSLLPLIFSTIFDFEHTQTSESLRRRVVVSPHPENMGIAVVAVLCKGWGIRYFLFTSG